MRTALAVALCLAAAPAAAFDCGKAATSAEKAICADLSARGADEAMAAAYAARLADATASEKTTLAAAQTRWLADRDAACTDSGAAAACLARESARRRAFLAAEPESGPGAPGRLEPTFRIETAAPGRAGLDLQLLKFPAPANPGERAFNSAVDRLVGALDAPDRDDPDFAHYEHDRTLRLVYASPTMISAHLEGYDDTGGAHPTSFSGDVNIDVAREREAKLGDLLDETGAKAVDAICFQQVLAQKKARLGADAPKRRDDLNALANAVADATGRLDAWSFSDAQASVGYDPYAVGSYAEGPYACELPYAKLRPLARAEFPLPQP